MKQLYNYIILAVMALVSIGCIEDINTNIPSAAIGDEVQFGLSLASTDTKTIYGPEDTQNHDFPIYWSTGDKILIASPQCVSGRNSAEYLVTPHDGQSYADAMTKTGEYGVQWGGKTSDFYSIYPSTNASWETLSESNVVAKLNISSEQSANLVLKNNIYTTADMDNVIMYARTPGVSNGDIVNLKYIPFSTILEFQMSVGPFGTNNVYGTAKILSMTISAPQNTIISGDFTLQFNGNNTPIVNTIEGSNKVSVTFTTQPVLDGTNKTLFAKLAIIPDADITSIKDWTISINVLEGTATEKEYTTTFKTSGQLVPGQIHKIKLPEFVPEAKWDYDEETWIPSLYDYQNIYITELSLPGAWYALGKNEDAYQTKNHTAKSLWEAGIRAFGVECRTLSSSGFLGLYGGGDPEAVVVSGTANNSANGGFYYDGGNAIKIRTVIKSIADQVASSVTYDEDGKIKDAEYAVLILSYADGGGGGHRQEDYQFFINGVKSEIASSGANNIYSGPVTASTTIADVLGKLIIKINIDNYLIKGQYDDSMNALMSYNPFVSQLSSNQIDYTTPLFSKLYWKSWEDTYKTTTPINDVDFLWCFSSANRTHADGEGTYEIPTYAQRKATLRSMIQHSKRLTEESAHHIWFYFNAGGTEAVDLSKTDTDAEDARNFAVNMNEWLYEVVRLKANGGIDTNGAIGAPGSIIESDPSPLGIVMFNQCTGDNETYHGADIIKEIIEMNNKFKLLRKQGTKASNGAYATVGGEAF